MNAGDPDKWDKQTHINLMAPMRLTRLLLPPMKDAGTPPQTSSETPSRP